VREIAEPFASVYGSQRVAPEMATVQTKPENGEPTHDDHCNQHPDPGAVRRSESRSSTDGAVLMSDSNRTTIRYFAAHTQGSTRVPGLDGPMRATPYLAALDCRYEHDVKAYDDDTGRERSLTRQEIDAWEHDANAPD